MSTYADAVRKPPKTMTEDEQRRFLQVTGAHRDGFRDHVMFSFALGTALREHEIAALNVGDVSHDGKSIKRRFALRVFKRTAARDGAEQEAILPDALRYKLEKFMRWKKANGESLDESAPVFASRKGGGHLTTRAVRAAFAEWQKRTGLERNFTFHMLRHTALTNLYRATKDPRLVQKVARHSSLLSTMIYTHTTDEDVLRAVRNQPC